MIERGGTKSNFKNWTKSLFLIGFSQINQINKSIWHFWKVSVPLSIFKRSASIFKTRKTQVNTRNIRCSRYTNNSLMRRKPKGLFVCFDNQNDSLFFRPMSLQRERLRAHECVVVVVEEFVVMVANDRHVHYNHHNASSFAVAALGRPVHPADCFSFYLYLLARILVHLVSPEKVYMN